MVEELLKLWREMNEEPGDHRSRSAPSAACWRTSRRKCSTRCPILRRGRQGRRLRTAEGGGRRVAQGRFRVLRRGRPARRPGRQAEDRGFLGSRRRSKRAKKDSAVDLERPSQPGMPRGVPAAHADPPQCPASPNGPGSPAGDSASRPLDPSADAAPPLRGRVLRRLGICRARSDQPGLSRLLRDDGGALVDDRRRLAAPGLRHHAAAARARAHRLGCRSASALGVAHGLEPARRMARRRRSSSSRRRRRWRR